MTDMPKQYSPLAKTLHWVIALIMIAQFPIIWSGEDLPDGPEKYQLYNLHKALGMTVFMLAWLRIAWRVYRPAPPLPAGTARWESILSHTVHGLLYVAMLGLPLTGWLFASAYSRPVEYFGLFTLPDLIGPDKVLGKQLVEMHHLLGAILFWTFLLHVAASLFHHFVRRDTILRRMLPFGRVQGTEG